MIPDSGVFAERTCGLNGTLCVEENPTDSYLSVQLSLEVRKLGGRETLYRLPTSLFKRRKRITSIFSVFADPRNEHVTPTPMGVASVTEQENAIRVHWKGVATNQWESR